MPHQSLRTPHRSPLVLLLIVLAASITAHAQPTKTVLIAADTTRFFSYGAKGNTVEFGTTDTGRTAIRLPRVLRPDSVRNPRRGYMVYSTSDSSVYIRNNFTWQKVGSGGGSYLAANGLTLSGNTLKLGGGFTENTEITGDDSYEFSLHRILAFKIGIPSIGNGKILYSDANGYATWNNLAVGVPNLTQGVLDLFDEKKNVADSSTASVSNYVTQYQRKKTSDSLAALIVSTAGTASNGIVKVGNDFRLGTSTIQDNTTLNLGGDLLINVPSGELGMYGSGISQFTVSSMKYINLDAQAVGITSNDSFRLSIEGVYPLPGQVLAGTTTGKSKWQTLSGGYILDTTTNNTALVTDYGRDTATNARLIALSGKQGTITLTTTGSSGAATLVSNTLNIPQYSGGGSAGLSYITQSTTPTGADTSKIWIDNNINYFGIWPLKYYVRGNWNTNKWYDSIANYTSTYKPLIILATGQSNMDIRPEGRTNASDSRVLYWNGTAWIVWSLGTNNNLGFQTAKNISVTQDRVTRVILSSLSGADITTWNAPSGARYTDIQTKITASKTTAVDLILWRQGEANNADNVTTYKAKIDTVFNRFRNETWFNKLSPIIVGGLYVPGIMSFGGPQRYFNTINNEADESLLYASNDGLFASDVTHFEGATIDSSGRRMAATYLFGKTKSSQAMLLSNDQTSISSANSLMTVGNTANNVAIGNNSLSSATASINNVAIGGQNSLGASLTNTTAVGYNANGSSSNTSNGTFIGVNAGVSQSQQNIVSVGYNAGGAMGTRSVAVGVSAGQSNTTGNDMTTVGHQSAFFSTGGQSAFLGSNAGNSSTVGNNSGVGYYALYDATGGNNTGIGMEALYSSHVANGTGIGYQAGKNQSGTGTNTFLGYQTGLSNTFNSVVLLGGGAAATQNLQIVLGTATQTQLKANLYKLNIDQTLPTTGGSYLGLNTTSGEIELQDLAPKQYTTTTRDAISTPANGYLVTNTTTNTIDAYDGTRWTSNGKFLSNSATLDFPSTAAGTSSSLTITVTGAADGDAVFIGYANASANANSSYTARVSAANTVTIMFNNYQAVTAIDPASGAFKAVVSKL